MHHKIKRFSRWISLIAIMAVATAQGQVKLLDPATQTKFVNPLPLPGVAQPDSAGGSHYTIIMSQFRQDLGLQHPGTGQPLLTTVWGYNGSYPGPTIEARRNKTINILWKNELKDSNNIPLQHFLPIDTAINFARPPGWPASGVPTVVHVHGGHNESASDGLPGSWYTPGFALTGPTFIKQTLSYFNDQEAATIWYHDHAYGITRMNVYMGLAGFYLIRDTAEENLGLPSGNYEIPLAIQDRVFREDGSLFYPTEVDSAGNYTSRIKPEMFGDFILVNGKAWPVLEVEPRKYRFRIVNGSDSRFYNLYMPNNILFQQIGSDGGLLNSPLMISNLLVAPGERADVVIDFSDSALFGQTLVLRNNAPTPFPGGDSVAEATAGQIMAFKVTKTLQGTDNSVVPGTLRSVPIQALSNPKTTRQLVLVEDEDKHGGLMARLGTSAAGGLEFEAPVTENPKLNDTEVWEIINTTPDAHPIHLHLVQYQVLNSQRYDTSLYEVGDTASLKLVGNAIKPAPRDRGWKDTYVMYPGEVTRIIAKFEREGLYVWHCHILTHEDHEMMRPFYVGDIPTSIDKEFVKANDAFSIQVYPNPFNGNINISLKLEKSSPLDISVYNMLGEKVATIKNGLMAAGQHNINWEGRSNAGNIVPCGVYLCRIRNGDKEQAIKMVRTN